MNRATGSVLLLLAACALAAGQETRSTEPFPPDWGDRDLEGRWHAYTAAMERAPESKPAWHEALAARRDWDVLEWIALTEPGFAAGKLLQRSNAPNWVRCAVWRAYHADGDPLNDSHGAHAAQQLLKEDGAGVVQAWLAVHPTVSLSELASRNAPPSIAAFTSAREQHPPLDSAQLFAGLSAPVEVLDFGDRTRAAPGAFYLQQLKRSLAALALASKDHEAWKPKLLALMRHPQPRVRVEALLTFPMMKPALVPVSDVVRFARDPAEHPRVREAAVMALTFAFESPLAWAEVHRVASDPAHPGFAVGVSRLGDVGDGFSLASLRRLERRSGDAAVVADAAGRLAERLAKSPRGSAIDQHTTANQIARAAHLALTHDPSAPAYHRWLTDELVWAVRYSGNGKAVLERIRDDYTASPDLQADGVFPSGQCVPIMPGEISDAARGFALRILAEAAAKPK